MSHPAHLPDRSDRRPAGGGGLDGAPGHSRVRGTAGSVFGPVFGPVVGLLVGLFFGWHPGRPQPASGRGPSLARPGIIRRVAGQPAWMATLLVWAMAAFGGAPVMHAGHALKVATAFEVCGSFGHRKVDADGQPVDTQARHDESCCLLPPLAPPPARLGWTMAAPEPAAPAALMAQPRLAAEWLGALSRGPPLSA